MSSVEVLTSVENGVRVVQLNRPKSKNAFNVSVYNTVTQILNTDADNDKVAVTILTGSGDYYSSGFDIASSLKETGSGVQPLRDMIYAFINYPKLLIALVNGPALGVAVTSAALCDIIYASDRATFQTPFLKLGLCAEGCSSYTFPRILGRSKASEMLFLGEKLTAQDAYQFGLVAKVIPHAQLDDFKNELKSLGKLSVNSIKVNKALIQRNYKNILCECWEKEMEQLAECVQSPEFSNAIMDFFSRKSKL